VTATARSHERTGMTTSGDGGSRWFIGVDQAWSAANTTGVAVLKGDASGFELVSAQAVMTIEAMAAIVRAHPGDWVIGIDAPLVVRNREGMRPSDRQITQLYGRFEAGAHPTNLTLLNSVVRGGELVAEPYRDGLRVVDEALAAQPAGRWAFETYPHAGMIELFKLKKTIKYKRGSVAEKRRGLDELVACLRRHLQRLDPPLRMTAALRTLLDQDLTGLRGKALKAHEDVLDAVFCAYLAGFFWTWGAGRHRLLGNPREGTVVLPAVNDEVGALGSTR